MEPEKEEVLEECPECGSIAVATTGHCKTCQVCGWSLCAL